MPGDMAIIAAGNTNVMLISANRHFNSLVAHMFQRETKNGHFCFACSVLHRKHTKCVSFLV